MDEHGAIRERLARVEEAVGFAQHDQDAFSAQLAAVQADVRALDQRLRRLEAGLKRLSQREAGSDSDAQSGEA